jgi:hypothetical protein
MVIVSKDSIAPIVSIKRSGIDAGLDGLFGYDASDVENESQLEVNSSGNVERILSDFECSFRFLISDSSDNFYDPPVILNPLEIHCFLKRSLEYSSQKNYSLHLMLFVNHLIQESYDAGHNNFTLDMVSLPKVDHGLRKIKGEKDNLVKFNIFGDVYFTSCNYVDLSFEGNVNHGCSLFNNSIVRVNGNVGSTFAFNSRDSIFKINGDVSDYFGQQSSDIFAFITGDVVGRSFGTNSNNLLAYVGGDILSKIYEEINMIVLQGEEGKKDPRYQILRDKINKVMGE